MTSFHDSLILPCFHTYTHTHTQIHTHTHMQQHRERRKCDLEEMRSPAVTSTKGAVIREGGAGTIVAEPRTGAYG